MQELTHTAHPLPGTLQREQIRGLQRGSTQKPPARWNLMATPMLVVLPLLPHHKALWAVWTGLTCVLASFWVWPAGGTSRGLEGRREDRLSLLHFLF